MYATVKQRIIKYYRTATSFTRAAPSSGVAKNYGGEPAAMDIDALKKVKGKNKGKHKGKYKAHTKANATETATEAPTTKEKENDMAKEKDTAITTI